MAREDAIEIEGKILEAAPGNAFRTELTDGRRILARVSGKMRMRFIRVLPGDCVVLEMSPYDLSKGRITFRHLQSSFESRRKGQLFQRDFLSSKPATTES